MTLSLIITTYNRFNLLQKCLLAISKQRVLPSEIILSDDGSQDDIVAFYKELKQTWTSPIKLVRQQHAGFRASRVRNNGVSVSLGDTLVFLDQDIIVPPNYFHDISLHKKPDNFLSSNFIRLSPRQTEAVSDELIASGNWHSLLSPRQIKPIHSRYRKEYMQNLLCRYTCLGSHGAKLRSGVASIGRADYIHVNGFDENFIGSGGEDDDLGRRLFAIGKTGYNFTRDHIPLHLHHEPNYHNPKDEKNSYYEKRKREVSRHNYRCENGFDAPRDDLEVFSE